MRKSILHFLTVIALAIILSACAESVETSHTSSGTTSSTSSSSASSGGSTIKTVSSSGESQSETYTASSPIFEIDSSTGTLSLSGLTSGQSVYMIKTNPTSSTISSGYTRYVSSVSGITTSSGTVSSSSSSSSTPYSSGPGSHGSHPCVTLALNKDFDLTQNLSESDRSVTSLSKAEQITPVVDETTKSIYVDTDADISTFAQKTATLRAIGTYCYVWVVGSTDDTTYWSSSKLSDGGEQINSEIAGSIADNFDRIYPMVRNVFGEESSDLIYGGNLYSMSDYSDTGSMVNIVIYDIGADYSSDSESGTVGYFYAKDYYSGYSKSPYSYSNIGKYFYIDAYYAANYTSMVYSTLAHEFQHMVDWGVKYMEQNISTSTWFNEMLSMLCEDMMKDYLEENNSDFTDDDSPFCRLPMFNRHYYDTGLEYKTSGTYDVYYSYANNYAFGSWLIRNYGGIDLINKLSTNAYADVASIVAASGQSIETLLKEYGTACLVNESGSGFNVSVTQSAYSYDGYDYPLDAINLWNLEETLPDLYETYSSNKAYSLYYSFDGPVYFGYNTQTELRPYGFTLSKVGTATSSEVTISFNTSSVSTSQKTYILIVD